MHVSSISKLSPTKLYRGSFKRKLALQRVPVTRCNASSVMGSSDTFGAFDEVYECPHLRDKLRPRYAPTSSTCIHPLCLLFPSTSRVTKNPTHPPHALTVAYLFSHTTNMFLSIIYPLYTNADPPLSSPPTTLEVVLSLMTTVSASPLFNLAPMKTPTTTVEKTNPIAPPL